MAENKEKRVRTVIHLQLLATDEHYYFGSIANMYEHFNADALGITYGSLRNYGLANNKPYVNKQCVIRKGILLSKSTKRGENIKRLLSL